MNKKIITILIVLMGISILGIIAVQLVWMNNAIRVKNELFNRSVNEALISTTEKLEDIHNFGVVNQMVFSDSIHWLEDHDINLNHDIEYEYQFKHLPKPPKINLDSLKEPLKPMRIIRESDPIKGETRVEVRIDSGSNNKTHSYNYIRNSNRNVNSNQVVISNQNSPKSSVFIFNEDTVFSDLDSLYTISLVKIDSVLTQLDTIAFVKPELSNRLKVKAGNLKQMANRVVTEIVSWDVNELDQQLVQEVLSEELQNRNIPIDFKYGIVRDTTVEFAKNQSDSIKLLNSAFKVDLYPNEIFEKNLKLSVFFPARESFIYRSLNWLLVASFIFSLFILTTFSLSIYYILRQKKISEMKSDFINNMTHEFKTPIATISVASDSITNDKVVKDPERIKYFVGMIKKENARMNLQVEDILTIARLDRKDFEFHWETIDVHDLIKDAVQGIIIQVEKKEGKIETLLDAKNSVITTDRKHCTNLIYNLLDNAMKYSEDSPKIKIETKNKENGVVISVIDNGIGMTKSVQGKIFEKFYRQSAGNIHNVKGFGLGLSYVKAVLEANKGTISVKSEPGKGSKFEVFLPFVRE